MTQLKLFVVPTKNEEAVLNKFAQQFVPAACPNCDNDKEVVVRIRKGSTTSTCRKCGYSETR